MQEGTLCRGDFAEVRSAGEILATLDDLRCDETAHGGGQADCRIYWSEARLTKVDTLAAPAVAFGTG
jgi:hypothetical protein